MSRETDVRVAKAMELAIDTQCPCDPKDDIQNIDGWQWHCEICGTTGYIDRRSFGTDISHNTPILEYSTDPSAARKMEDWIEEHDLQDLYLHGMMDALIRDKKDGGNNRLGWDLLHATPEQRCRAFLAVMEQTMKGRGLE